MFQYEDVQLSWLGHDGFKLVKGPLSIMIDPYELSDKSAKPVKLVLLTHEHRDHCSIEDLRKVVTPTTIIVCPYECLSVMSKLEPGEVITVKPGEERDVLGAHVKAIPAYNLNKYRDPETKTVYHPREDEKVGYTIRLGDTTFYHAGDTDNTPELRAVECDVAFLPVSGVYVMTVEEAVQAASALNPKLAIPMHYGSIVGQDRDATEFRELLRPTSIHVEILPRE